MDFAPLTSLNRVPIRYSGKEGVRLITFAEQFRPWHLCSWRGEREFNIDVTFGANLTKLYAVGLRHIIHRSTSADAKKSRDWIFTDVATMIIRQTRKFFSDNVGL